MINLMLLAFLGSMGQPQSPDPRAGIAVAKRLVAAMKGQAPFEQSDFEAQLRDADKAALRRFGACKVGNIDYAWQAIPQHPNEYLQDFNEVEISFACRGVSQDTPVGISLHLHDGKIQTVETHNADLMKVY